MSTIITIYEKPTCSTCRVALRDLAHARLEFREVNYYETPLTKEKLKSLIQKMGISAKDLLRTHEAIYKELNLSRKVLSEDGYVDLMIRYPDLMQRPIIEKGDAAILGRPPAKILQFLGIL